MSFINKNKILVQRISLILSDVSALLASFLVARYFLTIVSPEVGHITFKSVGIAKFGGLIVLAVFWYQEQYVKRRPTWEELALVYKTIFIFAVVHMGMNYVISHHVIKAFNLFFWGSLLFILPSFRYITKVCLFHIGLWSRKVYIVGTGRNAIAAAELLSGNQLIGYDIAAFVMVDENVETDGYMGLPILEYEQLLDHNVNDLNAEIVVALSSKDLVLHSKKINILQSHYSFVSIVPDITGLPLYGVNVEHFFGNDQLFLRLQNNLGRRLNRIIKRTMDITLSSIGIIILAPFIGVIALLIMFSTGGSAFFKHKRIGRDGKYFYCIKFKTMYKNSKELLDNLLATDHEARVEWEKDFKLKNDPRVTKVGRFLRKTSLDELPQLLNVVMGQMSLVGPRPIIDDEVSRYQDDFYYYKLVHPGITGLWQISGRNDIDYTQRVRLDVCYIKNWSLWYDFVILLKTFQVVMQRSGAY